MKAICVIALLFLTTLCKAQSFIAAENDSTIMTEYNDGKFWVYRSFNNFIVGLTCYEEKDDYGKYYQVHIFIRNLSDKAIVFCPEEISAYLQRKRDTLELEVYTNEEFQEKIKRSQTWAMVLYGISAGINAGTAGYTTSYGTTYSSNGYVYPIVTQCYDANAAHQANMVATNYMITLGQKMANDKTIKEQGYLKKTTIYPNEAVVGYMNIKRGRGEALIINVAIDEYLYSFKWDVSRKK